MSFVTVMGIVIIFTIACYILLFIFWPKIRSESRYSHFEEDLKKAEENIREYRAIMVKIERAHQNHDRKIFNSQNRARRYGRYDGYRREVK
jgi:hypothetical protein